MAAVRRASQSVEGRGVYQPGTRWRVVKPGAHLWGLQPVGRNVEQGWQMDLPVGTVLTCLGVSWTRGDGVPALKWGDAEGRWLANDCTFSHIDGGMWGGQVPQAGYLEPAGEE